jgi:DNA-binding XRE family transcriptional regulator
MNITREQCRAARCFLDWSRVELADAADLSPETIKNFETGVWQANSRTKAKLIEVFGKQGLQFITGGVGRRPRCTNCRYPFIPSKEPHVETAP